MYDKKSSKKASSYTESLYKETGPKSKGSPYSGAPLKKTATPMSKDVSPSVVNKSLKTSQEAMQKQGQAKANKKNLKDYAKIVGTGLATLVGGYYGLTKEVGGVEHKDASGRPMGKKTEKKRIWRWKDE